MKKLVKTLSVMLVLSLIISALASCGSSSATTQAATQAATTAAAKKEKLVVGITDFAPMDYQDENNKWIGFDAELAEMFADYIGYDIEFTEIVWDNKVFELNSGSISCVWNGMTLNEEVKNNMEYSMAYCLNNQVLVVPSSVADKYTTKESAASLTIACEAGSAGEEVAKAMGAKEVAVESQAQALMEVASGTAEACIIDRLMAGAMVGEGTSYPNLTYTASLNESEEYVVGFKTGSGMAEKFNEFYKEKCKDGSVMKLAEKYGLQAAVIIAE